MASTMVLSSRLRLAEADDPVKSGPETPGKVARRDVLVLAEGRAESQEERAVEGSAGTAHGRDEGAADLLEQGAGSARPEGWEACSRTAVIPRSMLMPWSASPMAESSAVSSSRASWMRSANVSSHVTNSAVVMPIGQTPQRSAGVWTGASHSRMNSSSSLSRVIEHPAISSDVM